MSIVLPGVEEVAASALRPVSILMRLLLPTLLRPMKAYSGSAPCGHWSGRLLLVINSAVFTCMIRDGRGWRLNALCTEEDLPLRLPERGGCRGRKWIKVQDGEQS